ncbi:MAG: type II toxin-antitoxin system HicB family antitoxin, partial [Burkholderiales bacterium]|nr:type II toxin-antitoxin system HicB family antitoxin [Burkholderiales bacterium]
AFHESVDDYLAACEKLGQKPDKPASGKMMLRVSPEIHGAAIRAAELSGMSLNQWAAKAIASSAGI